MMKWVCHNFVWSFTCIVQAIYEIVYFCTCKFVFTLSQEREAYKKRRHDLITESGDKIHQLSKENLEHFKAEELSDYWKAYVEYLDEMVVDGFFACINCSVMYLLENTDTKNQVYPLFEARLELQAPDMVFIPSLDFGVQNGFYELVEGIIVDVYKQASLVSRLAVHNGQEHYQVTFQFRLTKDDWLQ